MSAIKARDAKRAMKLDAAHAVSVCSRRESGGAATA
jgi:hypothetical protein